MLDIISMATLIIVFSSFAVFIMLIIIGGNMNKSEEEQRYEDEEQIKYLREYAERHKKNKWLLQEPVIIQALVFYERKRLVMEKEVYTWEQVRAYSIIALNNLLHSANEINLKNIKLCIDPLQTLYGKDGVVGYSKMLIEKEEKVN